MARRPTICTHLATGEQAPHKRRLVEVGIEGGNDSGSNDNDIGNSNRTKYNDTSVDSVVGGGGGVALAPPPPNPRPSESAVVASLAQRIALVGAFGDLSRDMESGALASIHVAAVAQLALEALRSSAKASVLQSASRVLADIRAASMPRPPPQPQGALFSPRAEGLTAFPAAQRPSLSERLGKDMVRAVCAYLDGDGVLSGVLYTNRALRALVCEPGGRALKELRVHAIPQRELRMLSADAWGALRTLHLGHAMCGAPRAKWWARVWRVGVARLTSGLRALHLVEESRGYRSVPAAVWPALEELSLAVSEDGGGASWANVRVAAPGFDTRHLDASASQTSHRAAPNISPAVFLERDEGLTASLEEKGLDGEGQMFSVVDGARSAIEAPASAFKPFDPRGTDPADVARIAVALNGVRTNVRAAYATVPPTHGVLAPVAASLPSLKRLALCSRRAGGFPQRLTAYLQTAARTSHALRSLALQVEQWPPDARDVLAEVAPRLESLTLALTGPWQVQLPPLPSARAIAVYALQCDEARIYLADAPHPALESLVLHTRFPFAALCGPDAGAWRAPKLGALHLPYVAGRGVLGRLLDSAPALACLRVRIWHCGWLRRYLAHLLRDKLPASLVRFELEPDDACSECGSRSRFPAHPCPRHFGTPSAPGPVELDNVYRSRDVAVMDELLQLPRLERLSLGRFDPQALDWSKASLALRDVYWHSQDAAGHARPHGLQRDVQWRSGEGKPDPEAPGSPHWYLPNARGGWPIDSYIFPERLASSPPNTSTAV